MTIAVYHGCKATNQLINQSNMFLGRFEVVRLNEENVSLKRELEKYRGSRVVTPDRRVTRKSKNKEKEKSTRNLSTFICLFFQNFK